MPSTAFEDSPLYIKHFGSLSGAEIEALVITAEPLYYALQEALNAYCERYPATTDSVTLYAVDAFFTGVKKQIEDDPR